MKQIEDRRGQTEVGVPGGATQALLNVDAEPGTTEASGKHLGTMYEEAYNWSL